MTSTTTSMTTSKSSFTDDDFSPISSKKPVEPITDIDLMRKRVAKAEEELAKARKEEEELILALEDSQLRLEDEFASRAAVRRLTPIRDWNQPTDFMVMESAILTMSKKFTEINILRHRHRINSPKVRPLLPGQTKADRAWQTWLAAKVNAPFIQEPGWKVEADNAWKYWTDYADELIAREARH